MILAKLRDFQKFPLDGLLQAQVTINFKGNQLLLNYLGISMLIENTSCRRSLQVTTHGQQHFEPETKSQSMKWHHPQQPRRKIFRKTHSTGKVMITVFWKNHRGQLLRCRFTPGADDDVRLSHVLNCKLATITSVSCFVAKSGFDERFLRAHLLRDQLTLFDCCTCLSVVFAKV